MKNLIMYKQGESSWINWIKKRIAHNLNFISLFQGPTGVGKTWSAISMAEMIDKDFSVDQVVFDFKELMDVINADWFKEKKWKIIIFDEPQATISNRSWQSLTNKLMNYLLSTFRHQNIILIFCCPYVDFLDSQSMKLLHCIFECVGVNKKKKLSRIRPKIQQYNSYIKKNFYHPLHVIKNKKTYPLRDWYLPKPSKEIIIKYEDKKTTFTSKLNEGIKKNLDELTNKSDRHEEELDNGNRKPLTPKQGEAMEAIANYQYKGAQERLGITLGTLHQHKKGAEKKGYSLEEFKHESL
jgi:hypothetical protein